MFDVQHPVSIHGWKLYWVLAPVGETKKEKLHKLKLQAELQNASPVDQQPVEPALISETPVPVLAPLTVSASSTSTGVTRPSYSEVETQCADRIIKNIVVSIITEVRDRTPEIRDAISLCSQQSNTAIEEAAEALASSPTRKSSALFCDGEKFQLQAILNNSQRFKDEHINAVKFPAACSMDFQPNDKMRSFGMLKAYIKSGKFKKYEFSVVTAEDLRSFDNKLIGIGMDKASRATYLSFFKQLPALISSAYNIGVVQEGWKSTGLCSMNMNVMLRQNPYFDLLDAAQKIAVVKVALELSTVAAEKGRIPDKLLHDRLYPVIMGTDAAEKMVDTRDYDKCPLNYLRTVWVTHEDTLRDFKDVQEAIVAEQVNAEEDPANDGDAEVDVTEDQQKGKKKVTVHRCRCCNDKIDPAKVEKYHCLWGKCGHRYCEKPKCVEEYHRHDIEFKHYTKKRRIA